MSREVKKMLQFTMGNDITKVKYILEEMGEDLKISIIGNEAHIGGVALVSEGIYNIFSAKNLNEFEIIKKLSDKLKKYDDINILIVSGIDDDDFSLDEIKEIFNNNETAIEKIDKHISSRYEMFHEFN